MLTTTFTAVEWTVELRKDHVFEHSTSIDPEEVTVNLPGFYLLLVDLEGTDQFEAQVELRLDSEVGDVIFSNTYTSVANSISASIPLPLIAGTVVVVRARGFGSVVETGTRITIVRLAVEASGWGSNAEPPWFNNTTGSTESPYTSVTDLLEEDLGFDDSGAGVILKSPDGHYWRVQVTNAGALTTTDLGTSL